MPKHYAKKQQRPNNKIQLQLEEKVKKKNDSESTTNDTGGDTISRDILQLQRSVGNRATQQILQNSNDATIQRLMSYNKYKKKTAAAGKRSHIRELDKAYKAYMKEASSLNNSQKLPMLKNILELCDGYLNDPKRQKSKRRKGVIQLRTAVQAEISDMLGDFNSDEFSDDHATEKKENAVGGGMNKLDYVKYDFDVTLEEDEEGNVEEQKIEGGEFEGYFKPSMEHDEQVKQTRGHGAGIKSDDPRYTERSIATYEIAKLLDPSLIPPTFMAKHKKNGEQVEGSIMKIVKGVTGFDKVGEGDDKVDAAEMYQNDPVFRQSISSLKLLDYICGQVDRHPGNYIIKVGNDGRVQGVVGIDNDLSFGDQLTDLSQENNGLSSSMFARWINAGGRITELEEIDRKFAEKIIQLSENTDKVTAVLRGLLTDSEIASTLSRLQSLSDFLRPLVNSGDEIIKSRWE